MYTCMNYFIIKGHIEMPHLRNFLIKISIIFFIVFSDLLFSQQAYPAAKTGGNYMHNFYLPPPSPTSPRWPAWSPDGQSLAFSMHGSVWRMALEGSTAIELTNNTTYDSSPAWSPDGKWIAYTAEKDHETMDLMLLNLKTGKSLPLKTGEHLYLDPAWSPDGSKLAYVSTEPNGYYNIYVQKIRKGKPVGPALQITQDNAYGDNRLYFGDYDLHIAPTWSPDGKELLFVTNRDTPLGSGGIWRMPVEKNGIKKARLIHNEQTLFRTRPHWSPDGTRFLYSSHVGGQFNHLYLLPSDGGEPYKITFGDWDNFHPRWSPDGTKLVYLSNEEGLPQLHVMKTVGGKTKKLEVKTKEWIEPRGTLQVIITDGETERPTPTRIYLQASNGKAYAPDGTYHRVGRMKDHLFHTDGTFTIEVPHGPLTIEAVKGFEYYSTKETVEIKAGERSKVTLTLSRMTNMPARGWYSGSTHVHMNYAGDLHNTLENLMFMSAAEDQSVVNELVANKDNRILDYQFFTGETSHLSTPERVLFVSEEYRPAFHGHVYFLGLTEHLLSPFASGYEGTAIYSLYPSNTDMLRLAGEQGAFRGYVHPYFGENDPLSGKEPSLGGAKSFPVDVALGTVEGLETTYANHATLLVWHHVLNNDFKIVLTGGEDSISNLYRSAVVGSQRSYVYLGDKPLTYSNWLEALREGRTFATNGPLLTFTVNGAMPGEDVRLPQNGGTVTLKGEVQSIVPLDKVMIMNNGEILKTVPLDETGSNAVFEITVDVDESGWYTLQAEGKRNTLPISDLYPQATTNAIRVYVGGDPIRNIESANYFVRWIDRLLAMAEAHPGWRTTKEKDHVLGQFKQAQQVYKELMK